MGEGVRAKIKRRARLTRLASLANPLPAGEGKMRAMVRRACDSALACHVVAATVVRMMIGGVRRAPGATKRKREALSAYSDTQSRKVPPSRNTSSTRGSRLWITPGAGERDMQGSHACWYWGAVAPHRQTIELTGERRFVLSMSA